MSGGSFDYAYSRVNSFVDDLRNRLDEHDKTNEWGEKPNEFSDSVLKKLAEIVIVAEYASKLMKEVEWLYSGDTGEDTFAERIKKIESEK